MRNFKQYPHELRDCLVGVFNETHSITAAVAAAKRKFPQEADRLTRPRASAVIRYMLAKKKKKDKTGAVEHRMAWSVTREEVKVEVRKRLAELRALKYRWSAAREQLMEEFQMIEIPPPIALHRLMPGVGGARGVGRSKSAKLVMDIVRNGETVLTQPITPEQFGRIMQTLVLGE